MRIEYLSIEEKPLEMSHTFTVCYTTVKLEKKSYIVDVYLKFKNNIITNNFLETTEFFSFMDAFIKKGLVTGHENSFFIVSQKNKIIYLKCKFSEDEYFLSIPNVKAILTIYNEFRNNNNNNFQYAIQYKTILSNYDSNLTIFSNYIDEKYTINEIKMFLNNDRKLTYHNPILNNELLKYYNMIKYHST